MKTAILFFLGIGIAAAQCGPNGTFNGLSITGDLLCTGKTGAAGYTAPFAAQTGLTVTAATHGQGNTPYGVCYDNAVPANLIAQTSGFPTTTSTGTIVFAWSGSKTGNCLISGLGNTVGPAGATGATGSTGSAATIAVGTVATGAAGSSATVTNSGTSGAAIFDMAIPRGATGATGNTGATGATGAAGANGTNGTNGTNGANGAGNNTVCTDATGSTTTYTCPSPNPTVTTLTGLQVAFIPQTTNSGSATLNVAALGAKTLKQSDCSTNLSASALTGGTAYSFAYNGTVFCQTSGAGGGSTFTGSGASAPSFSATPTFSLADLSGTKSPLRFEPAHSTGLTGNVTSVSFTNTTAGAKFSIAWLQDGTGGRTVAYGGSASNTCTVVPTANKTTTQFFEVAADGSTVIGTGCASDEGPVERAEETSAPATPPSGVVCWWDSTDHDLECKNSSGVVFKMFRSGVDANPVTGQVTATHLGSALPVAQGGTGATTAQGNGTKVQLSTGTTTTDNCVKFDSNGNTVDAGAACGTGGAGGTSGRYTQSFTGQTSVTLAHNLALSPVDAYILECFDGSHVKINPASQTTVDLNNVAVTFSPAATGLCTVLTGGLLPNGGYSQAFTGQTSVALAHNLGTLAVQTACYDGSGVQVFPSSTTLTSTSIVTVTFSPALTGNCVVTSNATVSTSTSGMADPGGNGMLARTSLNVTASRTITGTSNLITVTNGDGVSGNPTLTVGSNVARLDQGNTFAAGVHDFSGATHLRIPNAAGYTPTTNGHFGYDTTGNTYLGYVGAAVKTFAFLDSNITGNTTGSAATLTTPRSIYGNNFNGSAALNQIIGSAFGGTNNGFTKFAGATTSEKTYTLPDISTTILTTNALVTSNQGGTGVNNAATLTLGSANQNWATLGTGIVKNTTTTGAISSAASSDVISLFGGGSCSGFLKSDGTCVATLPVANGGTGTASTLTGLIRGNSSAMTAAELSGDVTTSGSNAATLANIPTAVPMAGSLLATAIAAPSTPASGKGSVYVDSTSKNISVKDDAGVVKHGVQTKAAVTSNFLTAINDAGSVTAAQPAFTDVSGTATAAQGGTGQSSYAVGDIPYASASTTISKLADVATGNVLISGGVTTAPSYGKVGLTTHVSGTLAVANGGTGNTTAQGNGSKVQLSTGTTATNNCVKFDANGNTVDSGAACGGATPLPFYDVTVAPYSAVCNGVADAQPGIQAAIDAAYAAGGGRVWIPGGTCLLKHNQIDSSAGTSSYFNIEVHSNIYLEASPGTTLLQDTTICGTSACGRHSGGSAVINAVLVLGSGGYFNTLRFKYGTCGSGAPSPCYLPAAAIVAGASQLTLTTHSDASHFVAGDTISLYNATWTTDVAVQEHLFVKSSNSSTGVVTFTESVIYDYSTLYAVNNTANMAATKNIGIKNLIVIGSTPVVTNEASFVTIDGCQFLADSTPDANPSSIKIRDSNTFLYGKITNTVFSVVAGKPLAFVEVDGRGSSHNTYEFNTFYGTNAGMGEYANRVVFRENSYTMFPNSAEPAIAIAGRDILFERNRVYMENIGVSSSTGISDFTSGDEADINNVRILNNNINWSTDSGHAGESPINIHAKDVYVVGNHLKDVGSTAAYDMHIRSSYAQRGTISDNEIIDTVGGSYGMLIESILSPDGLMVARNNITGSSGAKGIWVTTPGSNFTGGHAIVGNMITGFTTLVDVDTTTTHAGTRISANPGVTDH